MMTDYRKLVGISPTLSLLIVALLSVSTSACWPNYRIEESTEALDKSVKDVRNHLPEKDEIELIVETTDTGIRVEGTRQKTCRTYRLVQTKQRKIAEEKLKLGSIAGNIVAAAGGLGVSGYLLAGGAPSMKGRGTIMAVSGIYGLTNGILITVAPFAGERGVSEPKAVEEKHNDQMESCGTEAASKLPVEIVREGSKGGDNVIAETRLDADGQSTLNFEALVKNDVTLKNPFGTIRCKPDSVGGNCEPTEIQFTASTAAAHARASGRSDDFSYWLDTYQKAAPPDLIETMKTRRDELQEKYRKEAENLLEAGEEHLAAGEYDKGIEKVNKCLSLGVKGDECWNLADRIEVAAAREKLRQDNVLGAYSSLSHAVENIEDADRSEALLEKIKPKAEKLRPVRIADFAVTDEPSGYEVYFSVVNDDGEYVRAPGEMNLHAGYGTCSGIAREKVTPADYESVVIGVQQRPALVYRTIVSFNPNFCTGEHGAVKMSIDFKTANGRTLEGQTEFYP